MQRRSLVPPSGGEAHAVEDVARASDETPGVGVDVLGEVAGDGVREAGEARERGDESSAGRHAPAPSAVRAQATSPTPARIDPRSPAPQSISAPPVHVRIKASE
jgi:hypothetical protein